MLLYELLTGTTPLDRKRMKEGRHAGDAADDPRGGAAQAEHAAEHRRRQLPSIAANRGMEPAKLTKLVRGELDWIVMKALEKDRNRRYETANGFATDVQRYLADEPVQACPPSAGVSAPEVRQQESRVRWQPRRRCCWWSSPASLASGMATLRPGAIAVTRKQTVPLRELEPTPAWPRQSKRPATGLPGLDRDPITPTVCNLQRIRLAAAPPGRRHCRRWPTE